MRLACRNAVLGAAALAVLLAFGGGTAHAQSKCEAGKFKCVVKKKSCLLGLDSKALKTGIAPDPAKVTKCRIGFGGSCDAGANVGQACVQASDCPGGACVKGCFTKLEAKVPTPPDQPCPTSGDAPAIETKVDNFVNDIITDLDPGFPAFPLNACQAGKVKCVINKDKCILGVQGKAAQAGTPVDPVKLAKCFAKFGGTCTAGANLGNVCTVNSECPGSTCDGGCFTKVEAKGGCATTNDAQTEEQKVDAFDTDIVNSLSNAGPTCQGGANNGTPCTANSECPGGLCPQCPTKISFTGTSTTGILDTGWTGLGHDATTITDGTVTVNVTGCASSAPNCGVCTYSGPTDNAAGQLKVHRCLGDSSITCNVNADCGANAPCVFYFGSNLPLAAGGVATCVSNTFTGGISGTANVTPGTGGQSTGTALLLSRVYSGPTTGEPCPRCLGDGTANDGVKGGTCSAGAHAGAACDVSGASPNAEWGTTSLDCPPLTAGVIANLAIDLSNTTGTKSRTLSAANPFCSNASFATDRCQCDTCNNGSAQACSTNADCGAGICGGKRCISGANQGAACTLTSECPGSSCNTPGTKTQPNQCDGGDTDCAPGDNSPATSPNDHICGTGPFEQFCGPVETFRGCTSNADCAFGSDTCSVSRFRECFDTGHPGDVVNASGAVSPPSGHQSDPKLAALFCIGPTASSAVNGAAGLPGLGRLELTGHSVDNGTP